MNADFTLATKGEEHYVQAKLHIVVGVCVLLICLGFFAARVGAGSNTMLGRYSDLAASWWKVNMLYRQESLSVNTLLEYAGVPMQIINPSDLYVVGASLLCIVSPSVRQRFARIVPRLCLTESSQPRTA